MMALQGSPRRPLAGFGALLVALSLILAAAVWLWYMRRDPGAPRQPSIGIARADTAGILREQDANPFPATPGEIPPPGTAPAPPELFLAPAPPFQDPGAVPIASFLDYAGRMQFDSSRGQELRLPADEFGREPVVRLDPLTNLRRLDSLALAQGRILARIRSDVAVPALGLRSGDHYLWFRGAVGTTVQGQLWTGTAFSAPRRIELHYASRAPAAVPAGRDAWWVEEAEGTLSLWIVCGRGWCHTTPR